MMDDLVDKTMANLKLIGMINKGEKVCLRKGQLNIEQVDRLQSFRRWYNKDSRDVTLIHIRNTINDAIKIAKGLMMNNIQSDMKTWTVGALNQELKNCDTGLQNLKTTYIDDPSFLANIDVLCDKCKAQCEEIDRTLTQQLATCATSMSSTSPSTSIMSTDTLSRRGERSTRQLPTS
jgi:hypothetical protein